MKVLIAKLFLVLNTTPKTIPSTTFSIKSAVKDIKASCLAPFIYTSSRLTVVSLSDSTSLKDFLELIGFVFNILG